MAEWRLEWQNGRMTDGMAEWRSGEMAECAMVEQQNFGQNGRMIDWQNDGMTEWRNGGMTEWQNGGMAEC